MPLINSIPPIHFILLILNTLCKFTLSIYMYFTQNDVTANFNKTVFVGNSRVVLSTGDRFCENRFKKCASWYFHGQRIPTGPHKLQTMNRERKFVIVTFNIIYIIPIQWIAAKVTRDHFLSSPWETTFTHVYVLKVLSIKPSTCYSKVS